MLFEFTNTYTKINKIKLVSSKETASDRVLRGKAFNIAKSPKHYGHQRGLASMVY